MWNYPQVALLDPRLTQKLIEVHDDLLAKGELLSSEGLQRAYATFRQRFGPEILRGLSGEALLEVVKGNGRDGLVYWLEFKDDDEFPDHFGSIAGGSALKYVVYRRRETGAWTTGSPQAQREISTAEAVIIATSHRDQLLAASRLIDALNVAGGDRAYSELQAKLQDVAPDVQDSSWGHKYLSLIHHDKLDDYHAASYQQYHLVKVLQRPPSEAGRYANAFRFLEIARELDWPMNHLTSVMNRRDGSPHRYWRIGTRDGSTDESFWEMMQRRSVAAIGWHMVGDLAPLMQGADLKEALREQLARNYPKDPRATGRAVQQIAHFAQTIQPRDYVVAADGLEVLGIGRVQGDYQFDGAERFPHLRQVEWLSTESWRMPTPEGLRTTVHQIRKHPENLIQIERRALEGRRNVVPRLVSPPPGPGSRRVDAPRGAEWTEGGLVGRIQDVLTRKSQLILYGPPGTGKTYWAERAAHELAALWNFGNPLSLLPETERRIVTSHAEDSYVRICSFHPGYGYEDFIEGYRPSVSGTSLQFQLQDGIFKRLCERAGRDERHRYYLIIDEINRGDIPRIFGELLTLLEKPKRGSSLTLPLSGASFSVPPNLLVIGTMNTADRSIALLDAALRRRFGFIELMPDTEVLGATVIGGIAIGPWLTALNQLIVQHVGRDGRHLQVGHSYFLNQGRPITELRQLARVVHEDLLPLLEEYCYDDWTRLEQILGKRLVDTARGRFRYELFDPAREEDMIQAILAIAPEVSASAIAVAAEGGAHLGSDEDDGEAEEPTSDRL